MTGTPFFARQQLSGLFLQAGQAKSGPGWSRAFRNGGLGKGRGIIIIIIRTISKSRKSVSELTHGTENCYTAGVVSSGVQSFTSELTIREGKERHPFPSTDVYFL